MTFGPVEKTLEVCRNIQFARNKVSVYKHLVSEVEELRVELYNEENDLEAGADGVIGEAVDIILCALDIIYQHDKDITQEAINEVVLKKLNKWQAVYSGKDATVDETVAST